MIKKVIRTENKSKVIGVNNFTDTSQNSIGVGSYTSLLMSEDLVRKASEVETKRSAVNVSLVRNWGMPVELGAPEKTHTHTQTGYVFEEVQYKAYLDQATI